MANLIVSNGITVNRLQNNEALNTTLNSTAPLYQTFKKGTNDYSPNWATMADAQRPVIFPRVYSTREAKEIKATNVKWKYNGVEMKFGSDGVATFPDIAAGKVKQIDYNGGKALKMIGNVASDTNNDSDTITFSGFAAASGQNIPVSSEATILVEEASANLYRLFINMADDVIDGDETSLTMVATLFNNGAQVNTGAQYEFAKIDGTVLRAKNTSGTFTITREMIDSELLVVCKAFVNDKEVAREQKQVWDSTDPYVIIDDKGTNVRQSDFEDITHNFTLKNMRTGETQGGVVFTVNVYNNANGANITSEFSKTNTSITIPGAKIAKYNSIYIHVSCEI